MRNRLQFLLHRMGEVLWIKPLVVCLLSAVWVILAAAVDYAGIGKYVPDISSQSIESLLTIISSSMLVIATFAVGSMVSAYASASKRATPRSFSLMVADDVSQNALSTFIGAFIFSVVAYIAVKNGDFDRAGRFVFLVLTVVVFSMVVLTFVRWVDRVARLGRLETAVDKVEEATTEAFHRRRSDPTLGGMPAGPLHESAQPLFGERVGYVQHIDVRALQSCAEDCGVHIRIAALPGTFSAPGVPLVYVRSDSGQVHDLDPRRITEAFRIDHDRTFYDDPRFGLIVLSEIASRALSPGINDPGTAIQVIGAFVRLFVLWSEPVGPDQKKGGRFDRVEVPVLSVDEMFADAFTAIARDGSGIFEVSVRLQKALAALATLQNSRMRKAAKHHARMALARSEKAMAIPEDLEAIRRLAVRTAST